MGAAGASRVPGRAARRPGSASRLLGAATWRRGGAALPWRSARPGPHPRHGGEGDRRRGHLEPLWGRGQQRVQLGGVGLAVVPGDEGVTGAASRGAAVAGAGGASATAEGTGRGRGGVGHGAEPWQGACQLGEPGGVGARSARVNARSHLGVNREPHPGRSDIARRVKKKIDASVTQWLATTPMLRGAL